MQNPNAIGCITVYHVEIPYVALGSRWLGRDKPEHLDSTVVTVETEAGLSGVGESCPIGAIYLPAFSAGLRAALAEMAPALLGVDATQTNLVNRVMDQALFGHAYAKAAIDIACWDLFGKHCGPPVSALLGGRCQTRIPLYASNPLGEPDAMVALLQQKQGEGYTRFQVKVGEDPVADAARARAVIGAGRTGDLFAGRRAARPGCAQRARLLHRAALRKLRGKPAHPRQVYSPVHSRRSHRRRR